MLTAKKVEREKRPGRYRDGHIRGLYLQIGPTGGKAGYCASSATAASAGSGWGRYPWSICEPRASAPVRAAAPARRHRSHRSPQGREGQTGRRQGQAAHLSRGRAAYFDQHEGKWKNAKHRAQFLSTLEAICLPGARQHGGGRHRHPGGAARDRAALADENRNHEPGARPDRSGARLGGRARLSHAATIRRAGKAICPRCCRRADKSKRSSTTRQCPTRELPGFMAELRKREGVAARALEFAILTAARTGEVIGARRDEISFEDKIWTDTGRPHEGRPRAPGAVIGARHRATARACRQRRATISSSLGSRAGSGLSNMAMAQVLKRMNRGDITVHGFRSQLPRLGRRDNELSQPRCRDGAGARDRRQGGGRLSARRSAWPSARQLMEAWSRYCTSPPPAGAVLPLRRSVP